MNQKSMERLTPGKMEYFLITTFFRIGDDAHNPKTFGTGSWEVAAERIEWALDFPKPFISLNRENFDWFTTKSKNCTFILTEYSFGPHAEKHQTNGRLTFHSFSG